MSFEQHNVFEATHNYFGGLLTTFAALATILEE